MKNKTKILLGSIFFTAILLVNLSIILKSDSSWGINTTLDTITMIANADGESGEYQDCVPGWVHHDGMFFRWCGDCKAKWVISIGDGYCVLW